MRILSLGFPIPGTTIDNRTFASAPAFFDYDAVVVDTAALSTFIEDIVQEREEHTAANGDVVVNSNITTTDDAISFGQTTAAGSITLADGTKTKFWFGGTDCGPGTLTDADLDRLLDCKWRARTVSLHTKPGAAGKQCITGYGIL